MASAGNAWAFPIAGCRSGRSWWTPRTHGPSTPEPRRWRSTAARMAATIGAGSPSRNSRVAPHDPRVLYACLSPAAQSTDGALYKSADCGSSWQRFDHGVKAEATMMGVALHPRDPNQVYGITRCGQVFGTTDGGRSW